MVRNEWAHPRSDFAKWTKNQYDKCFTFLEDLVKLILEHDPQWNEEQLSIASRLSWWKQNGRCHIYIFTYLLDILVRCIPEVFYELCVF